MLRSAKIKFQPRGLKKKGQDYGLLKKLGQMKLLNLKVHILEELKLSPGNCCNKVVVHLREAGMKLYDVKQVLSGRQPNFSCQLTRSPVDSSDKLWLRLSLLESVIPFVVLEHDFVETDGALPVDCTPTIKSIQGL